MKKLIIAVALLIGGGATAETFNVDLTSSKINWKAGKKIGSFHNGSVKVKSGTVETDAQGQIKSINVVADMKTISNDDLKDKPDFQKKLVGHLSSDDFFKIEKFPEASFVLSSISPKAGAKDEYTVKGQLTMIGATKPVEFSAKISSDKNVIKGTATVQIERLKWGLQYGSGSIFKTLTADKIINDSFELMLDLKAKK